MSAAHIHHKLCSLSLHPCKPAIVLIVNGRMSNNSSGNSTFKNISIIVDYFLCCPLLFKYTNNFIVYDGNPLFSYEDSVLELVLNTKVIPTQHAQCHYNLDIKRAVIRWQHNKKPELQTANSTLLNYILTNVV